MTSRKKPTLIKDGLADVGDMDELTVSEVNRRLHLHEGTAMRAAISGELKSHRRPGGKWRYVWGKDAREWRDSWSA